MTLILNAAVASHVGLVRSNNEDSAFAGRRLVAVADGIGGLPAGELASEIVIAALRPLEDAGDVTDPAEHLRVAVDRANDTVLHTADQDPEREGMGTTITALLLSGTSLGLVHVGDSRCYLLRGHGFEQVTKDHTFVQTLVDEGVLTREDARFHPRRSLVTQAVQGHEYVPTVRTLTARPADRFLLCSDGLSDIVTDESLAHVLLSNPTPADCARVLVALALSAGAPDNVTVVVADVADTDADDTVTSA